MVTFTQSQRWQDPVRARALEQLWTESKGKPFPKGERWSFLYTAGAVESRVRKCVWRILASLSLA